MDLAKEKNQRYGFRDSETSNLLYKQLYKNSSFNIKRRISFKFFKKRKASFRTRINNKCLITGRSRGLLCKKFKMSRFPFRLLAARGEIPGVSKRNK